MVGLAGGDFLRVVEFKMPSTKALNTGLTQRVLLVVVGVVSVVEVVCVFFGGSSGFGGSTVSAVGHIDDGGCTGGVFCKILVVTAEGHIFATYRSNITTALVTPANAVKCQCVVMAVAIVRECHCIIHSN